MYTLEMFVTSYLLDELELIWDLLLRLPLPLPLLCDWLFDMEPP
jgi:hypothetical protein